MLAAQYRDWPQFLLTQVDRTIEKLVTSCGDLQRCTWGARHPVRIRHPLSGALPGLSRLLDMPVVQLPGDHDMPRVQDGPIGASERFAVSPGTKRKATSTSQGLRAVIRSRRITRLDSWSGRAAL